MPAGGPAGNQSHLTTTGHRVVNGGGLDANFGALLVPIRVLGVEP